TQFAAFLAAGISAGVVSGAMGVGGAVVATPLVRLIGLGPHLAIGTTVPAILPAALTGAYAYRKEGLIDSTTAIRMAIPGALASFGGALATRSINGHLLMVATAGVLAVLALRNTARSGPSPPQRHHGAVFGLSLGVIAGFFSGLLGIGGGFLIVPALIRFGGFPVKTAVGTSLAAISLMSIPNVAGQALAGNVSWVPAGLLAAGVIPGARLGAKLAIAADEAKLRWIVGGGLALAAAAFGISELRAIFF
ncbi:MAG: sulfite exporter TauE/SafE family protein, partial [Actinomycetota bacterium]